MKNKIINFFRNKYIKWILFLILGFIIGSVVFGLLVSPNKDFVKSYYTLGNIDLQTKTTLACKTLSEADIFSGFDKKIRSSLIKNPDNPFSLSIDPENAKLGLITSAAVEAGMTDADKYDIVSFEGDTLTVVGYSGISLVTVALNIKEGTVIVSKAGNGFLGLSGIVWFGTCY